MSSEGIDIKIREDGSRVVERNLDGIGKTALRVDGIISLLKRSLLTLGVGLTLGGTIATLANFSQEMSTVKAITGATESQFQMLREEAKRLGAETRFSASQAAEGAQFLARAGFNTSQVMESLESTLTLAQSGAMDLGSAADIASNILTGFRMKTSQASEVVDVLSFTANRANTNVGQLGEAMQYAAPVAAGMGVSIRETAAAVAALSDAGLQGSTAGTGLRNVLARLESPSGSVAKILSTLGVNLDEVKITTVGLIPAIERLRKAGVDTGMALQLFGMRGGPAFEVLSSSIPKIKQMNKALEGSEGFAKRVSDIMDDNLNGALLATRSAVEALQISLGDLGAESMLTRFFRGLADAIRFAANNLDRFAEAAMYTIPLIAVLFSGPLLTAIGAVSTALKGLFVLMMTNPFIVLAAGITAAVSWLVFYKDEIRVGIDETTNLADVIKVLASDIKSAFSGLFEIVSSVFSDVYNSAVVLFSDLTGINEEYVDSWGDYLGSFFSDLDLSFWGVTKGVARVFDAIGGLILGFGSSFVKLVKSMPQLIVQVVRNMGNKVIDWIEATIGFLTTQISKMRKWIGMEPIELIKFDRMDIDDDVFKQLGADLKNAFYDGFDLQGGALEKYVDDVIARAVKVGRKRIADTLQEITVDAVKIEGFEYGESVEQIRTRTQQELDLLEAYVEARKNFALEIQAINQLTSEPDSGFTQDDASRASGNMLEGMGINTDNMQVGIDARLALQQEMYANIDLMREADLISEQDASYAKMQLWAQEYEMKAKGASDLFGELAKLSSSSNSKIAAIGKAAAITQSIINTSVAATRAYAEGGPFLGPALAAAIVAAGMVQVANIRSQGTNFATGGSFKVGGTGGVDSQMVAFRATPGEQVNIATPTQVRHGTGSMNRSDSSDQGSKNSTKIINVFDPSIVGDYLRTDQGEELMINIMQKNQQTQNY